MPPKVSVLMITYNQERYISQAIESVLSQQTDFSYEIVVGEDFSTDNTREVCREYQQRYPDKIRLLERDKNLGMAGNFLSTFKECNGQYLAVLEGDDYWVNPHKLQSQVDFWRPTRISPWFSEEPSPFIKTMIVQDMKFLHPM